MRSGRSRRRTWQAVFAVATVLAVVLLASHPELRLLVPLIELMGIDVFVAVIGIQCWAAIGPHVSRAYRLAAPPLAAAAYRTLHFCFGCFGPWVDAQLTLHRMIPPAAARQA